MGVILQYSTGLEVLSAEAGVRSHIGSAANNLLGVVTYLGTNIITNAAI